MIRRTWTLLMVALAMLIAGQAMAFTLTDSTGKTHRLEDYRGKWVLVNFWAPWCPPCLEEIPDLVALHEDARNNLVVIGIAMDFRDAKQVLGFAEQMMVSYPMVLGNPRIAAQVGQVRGYPTTYLYNPQGRQVAYQSGTITRQDVERYIRGRGGVARK